MDSTEARRRNLLFAFALAILAIGAVAITALGQRGDTPKRSPGGSVGRALAQATEGRGRPQRLEGIVEARLSASRFLGAYLRYEAGSLRGEGRGALLRYSTPSFGGQLLRAPVRIPPGSRPPRQFVARVAAVQAGLFDGRAALIATAVIAGASGTHLLRASLVELAGHWVVAGIGP